MNQWEPALQLLLKWLEYRSFVCVEYAELMSTLRAPDSASAIFWGEPAKANRTEMKREWLLGSLNPWIQPFLKATFPWNFSVTWPNKFSCLCQGVLCFLLLVTHWLKRFLSIVQSNCHTQKIDTHFRNSAEPSVKSRLTLSALRLGEGVRRPTQISSSVAG